MRQTPSAAGQSAPLRPPRWIAIAAMAENRVIGAGNRLPWHLPAEFAWFKSRTIGKVLLMGRRTYESLGRPLPKRHTLVLSRSAAPAPGADVVGGLPAAAARARELGADELWICGGAELYGLTLPLWDEAYITTVRGAPEGDVFLPAFEAQFPPPERVLEDPDFVVHHYRRR